MDPFIGFVLVGLLTLCAGFLSSFETLLASAGKLGVSVLFQSDPRARRFLEAYRRDPRRLVGAIGLLADLLLAAAGALTAGTVWALTAPYGWGWEVRALLAVGVVAPFVLAFGGIFPRVVERRALGLGIGGWLRRLVPLLYWAVLPLLPLAAAAEELGRGLRRVFRLRFDAAMEPASREEQIEALLEAAAAYGLLDEEEERMIRRIFAYDDRTARQVMVPRPEVVMIAVETPISEVREIIAREGHSRYPVYEGTRDNVIGILHAKDLLRFGYEEKRRLDELRRELQEEFPERLQEAERRARQRGLEPEEDPAYRAILRERERLEEEMRELRERLKRVTLRDLIRPPFFTPTIKPIGDLLREFQRTKQHMAVVVDEFGSVAGIVTLEDILEEIVGEISDEYDQPERPIRRLSPREYLVDGDAELSLINEELGLNLPTNGAVTIGGLITQQLEEIPRPGRTLTLDGVTITVESATAREVLQVRLRLPEPVGSAAPSSSDAGEAA